MPQFIRQSARPLTAESYQREAARLRALAENIASAARIAHSVTAAPRDRARLTRAIHELAMSAKRLSARHRGMSEAEMVTEESHT